MKNKEPKVNQSVWIRHNQDSAISLEIMGIPRSIMARGGFITQVGPAGVSFMVDDHEWHLSTRHVHHVLDLL